MKSAIRTFLTCDSRYITPLSVMVFSILKNANPERELHIHIAHDQSFADKGCRETISSLCARYPFARAHFHNAEKLLLRHKPVFESGLNKWAPIIWAGPLLADVLPDNVTGKIIYLDVDMLVLTRLDELADLDLGDRNVAAAVVEGDRWRFAYLEACEWPAAAGDYYNNGTMVVDLDRYRRLRICERIVEWYAKYRDAAICTDQDSQNAVFGDRIASLPPKWNYNDGWLSRIVRLTPFTKTIRAQPRAAALEAINSPCIIHYINRKPWTYTHRPARRIYHRYMQELGVFDPALSGTSIRQKLELALYNAYNGLLAAYARLLLKLTT